VAVSFSSGGASLLCRPIYPAQIREFRSDILRDTRWLKIIGTWQRVEAWLRQSRDPA